MDALAPEGSVSVWKRLVATMTAFAEAAETDVFTYQDRRIGQLERRIAALENADSHGAPSSQEVEL